MSLKTNYDQIVDVSKIGEHGKVDFNGQPGLIDLALQEKLAPNARDSVRRLLLCIDVQKDFMEGGALGVTGSLGDVERMTKFIYNNMEGITDIMCSMDTHYPFHIFFPSWWENADGENPAPYTEITYDDVSHGIWRPVYGNPADSLTYLQELEKQAKKKLCIWTYHCIHGTEGFDLENEFAKMVYFHAAARKTIPRIIHKGTDFYSEMYGIIRPEYSKRNLKNTRVLNAFQQYDEIYVVGEAASHCLMESVKQIAEEYATRPEITSKITILEDCTSPITGCEQLTKDAFDNFKRTYGIKFAKSTDIQLV